MTFVLQFSSFPTTLSACFFTSLILFCLQSHAAQLSRQRLQPLLPCRCSMSLFLVIFSILIPFPSELSRLSFDATADSSLSSPAQFNTPSFSTTVGAGGRTTRGNSSLPRRGHEEFAGREIAEGSERGAVGVKRIESPGLMSRVTCALCSATKIFEL